MTFSPKDAADACINKSRKLLDLASKHPPITDISDDLCRYALLTAVASIDTYMHWLVFSRLSEVRHRVDLPKSLAQVEIPFSALVTLADSAISARQNDNAIRPWVRLKNTLQSQLLDQTFQSYDQVAGAFALAGIKRPWTKVAEELDVQADDIKQRLNQLVHRRNQIAHEGDIMRMSRPREMRFNQVDYALVTTDVDWVENLLNAMQVVVAAEQENDKYKKGDKE
jgi:hypothetical protein